MISNNGYAKGFPLIKYCDDEKKKEKIARGSSTTSFDVNVMFDLRNFELEHGITNMNVKKAFIQKINEKNIKNSKKSKKSKKKY